MSIERVRRGVWRVRWRDAGRNRSRTFSGEGARAAAEAFQASVRDRRVRGAYAAPTPSEMDLTAWVAVWWRRDAHTWRSEQARKNRRNVFERWILPYLGGVRLRDLGQVQVREFIAQVVRDGATAYRANVIKKELSACLGAAVRDGLLPHNPCGGVRKLAHRVTGHQAWPPIVLERLRAEMKSPRDRLLVSLMYMTGVRPEEAMALTWRQVREHTALIDRAASDGKVNVTKTATSGVVQITPLLRAELDAYRPAGARPDDLVFPSATGGVMSVRNWRARVWNPARAASGIVEHATPYDCRHTFASLLIHEGADILRVSRLMRHTKPDITLRVYSHEFAEWELRDKIPMEVAIGEARVMLERERRAARVSDRRHGRLAHSSARAFWRSAAWA